MAAITLSFDGDYVSGTQNVTPDIPLVLPLGTVSNVYTLPGNVVQTPGSPFTGYSVGSRFTVINLSAATHTFVAPSGYTLVGAASLAAGNTTPTRITLFLTAATQYAGF